MDDTAKYLIHADITANGVVERSDVVGAVFGQTEGLLGDDLDLRDLQQTSKVGRIDVDVQSQNGQSYGTITIASSLDKVETAILAAALETINRVGPCRSTVSVDSIEDVRAAKRHEIVDRAKELLTGAFEEDVMTSDQILEEVRQSVRVERITEYQGYPAGPRVEDSDAIIVVEGRSDVLTLLQFGIKNAVAVEGTNVPDEIAELTERKTVTAFLDGDRGGDLILKELAQVGDVDYVAFAPPGRSVEDLERHEVMTALRGKVEFESLADSISSENGERTATPATDGSTQPAPEPSNRSETTGPSTATPAEPAVESDEDESAPETDDAAEPAGEGSEDADESAAAESADADATPDAGPAEPDEPAEPETLRGHVAAVIDDGAETARLLDTEMSVLADVPAEDAFDAIADAETVPAAVVIDGDLTQRVLDVAAQRGVEQVVSRGEGQFVKKPTSVRVRTGEQFQPA